MLHYVLWLILFCQYPHRPALRHRFARSNEAKDKRDRPGIADQYVFIDSSLHFSASRHPYRYITKFHTSASRLELHVRGISDLDGKLASVKHTMDGLGASFRNEGGSKKRGVEIDSKFHTFFDPCKN